MTLLPANATKYERALEKTCARSFDLPVLINRLRNPWECPLSVLPWLAYEWSVDEWNEEWSEQQKRATVAASIAVHKKKGTRGAVEDALAALDVDVTAREWWEEEPKKQPGTFALQVNGNIRSSGAYDELLRVVNAAKNTRSHISAASIPNNSNGEISVSGVGRLSTSLTATLPNELEIDTASLPVSGYAKMHSKLVGTLPTLEDFTAEFSTSGHGMARMHMTCSGRLDHSITVEDTTLEIGGICKILMPIRATIDTSEV